MHTVYIRDLFKFGHFGPVRPGMTRDEVAAKLGPPDWGGYRWWWQSPDEPEFPLERCPVWVYSPFEFYWEDKSNKLDSIYCDHLELLRRPTESIKVSPWIFRNAQPLMKSQFEVALQRQKIDYVIEDNKGLFGLFILASGVTVAYEYEEEWKDHISMISFPNFRRAAQKTI